MMMDFLDKSIDYSLERGYSYFEENYMTWKTIPSFPLYEINILGEVRSIKTGKLKTSTKTNHKHIGYILYVKGQDRKSPGLRRSINVLLEETFGIEKPLNAKKKPKPIVSKACVTCNWYFDGQCAVKNPGMVCEVEKEDTCPKFEKIRRDSSEYHFDDSAVSHISLGIEN